MFTHTQLMGQIKNNDSESDRQLKIHSACIPELSLNLASGKHFPSCLSSTCIWGLSPLSLWHPRECVLGAALVIQLNLPPSTPIPGFRWLFRAPPLNWANWNSFLENLGLRPVTVNALPWAMSRGYWGERGKNQGTDGKQPSLSPCFHC